jgi:hypothetical protein
MFWSTSYLQQRLARRHKVTYPTCIPEPILQLRLELPTSIPKDPAVTMNSTPS